MLQVGTGPECNLSLEPTVSSLLSSLTTIVHVGKTEEEESKSKEGNEEIARLILHCDMPNLTSVPPHGVAHQ